MYASYDGRKPNIHSCENFFMAFKNNCSTLNQMLITKKRSFYSANPYIVLICFKILCILKLVLDYRIWSDF